jgi:hypothetical protein
MYELGSTWLLQGGGLIKGGPREEEAELSGNMRQGI